MSARSICASPARAAALLLSGVTGVLPAHVVVLGDGAVGQNAARRALALGARVTVLGKSIERMRWLDEHVAAATVMSSAYSIAEVVPEADLFVGAVLVPGERAPRLVSREVVSRMRPGSVIVDVAIDQGGCVETSRPTSHDEPVFVEEGVVHYCVPNMPGAVPATSTMALANSLMPYVELVAAHGLRGAIGRRPGLAAGVSTYGGAITHPALAHSVGRPYTPLS